MGSVKIIMLKVIFLFWFVFVSLLNYGQDQIVFEKLTIKDGLSNGTINSIFKDSRGFMWFCTEDGLNRYDGYTFKVYNFELTNNTSQANINFIAIAEDRFGRLWLGTSDGLFIYDQINDQIVQFSSLVNIDISNNSITGVINCMLIDSFNNLWIGTFTGISRINISNRDLTKIREEDVSLYTVNSIDSLEISNNFVLSILEDKQHQVWVSSNSNLLDCYNYESNNFTHHKIEIPNIDKFDRLTKRIIIDKDDNFWIYTLGFGLIYWDKGKQTFLHFKTLTKGKEVIDIGMIESLIIDKLDQKWIGTNGNGLVLFDEKRNEIEHYSKDLDDQSNISSNAIYSIFEDSSDIYWIGTYLTGLNKFVLNKLNFGSVYSSPNSKTGLNDNLVTGFCEDKNKQIWISTDGGGLNLFNLKTHQFKHYKNDPENSSSISTNTTMTVFCDHENRIWIGTYNGGLNRFDQKTGKFDHYWYNPDDSTTISSNHPWSFAQDKSNNLWVATVDAGLNLLKPGTTSFIRYTKDDYKFIPDQLCSNSITQLFVDKKNCLWIGTEYGLDWIDLNLVDFSLAKPKLIFNHFINSEDKNSLSSQQISCINEDGLGNLWIGTKGGGLNKLDLKTQNFTRFNVKDGLPHSVINGILIDLENNLWISTNNGLSNFNVKTEKFKNYYESDGLQSSVFVKTSCLKTIDGMFLFGGTNGFNAFYPEKIVSKTLKINPVITYFNLFNKHVAVGEKINNRIILPKPIFDLNEIDLFYKENSFTFGFSALEYSIPEKIYYSYKLSGFDDQWQITDAKMRIAKYTNLSPGKYTLHIKASNDEDIWSESETSLVINIIPPWWKTVWFKIIAGVFAISLWILLFMFRLYQLKKQKRILTSKVAERTKELLEANNTKDKFLSIISHDLINPFNTILGFSELLLSNYSDWNDEARIESIQTINDSSSELFKLLTNLLQWSRSERGLIQFSPQKIVLNKCIINTISLQMITAKAKEIKIHTNLSAGNCMVKSDEQLLSTIIRNLVSNAIKFTPVGGVITIKTEKKDNEIIVSIADNGIGISKKNLDNLFKIDIEHSTLGTNDEKGTGLGLFLVKEFVIKQKGTLNIESMVGKGSVFLFTIPCWNE